MLLLILSRCQSEESHADTPVDWWELIPLGECAPPIATVGGRGAGRWDEDTRHALIPPYVPLFLLLLLFILILLLLLLRLLLLLILLQLLPLSTCKSALSPTQSPPLILIALSGSKAKLTCPLPNSKSNDFYCYRNQAKQT